MASERAKSLEKLITEADAALRHPVTEQYVGGGRVMKLQATLSRAVIANVRHGVVNVPENARAESPVLVAMNPDEKFKLGSGFDVQTPRQAKNAAKVYDQWRPANKHFDSLMQQFVASLTDEVILTAPHENSAAVTHTKAVMTRMDDFGEVMELQSPPEGKIGKIMLRPLVVVRMGITTPDVLCHELVHVKQKIDRPVRVFGSQHDINMDALGDELEAYHMGAGVRIALESHKPVDQVTDPHTQLAAEGVRLDHNKGYLDPFAPSDSLYQAYQDRGMGHILHGVLNYDAILQGFEPQD